MNSDLLYIICVGKNEMLHSLS